MRETFAFPYTPNEAQTKLIRFLQQQRLDKDKWVFLESPTGSGKTVAVLYALLSQLSSEEQLVFASRTHSQLLQASREFARVSVHNSGRPAVVLASKKFLCLNPLVNTPNATTEQLAQSCRLARKQQRCPYFDRTALFEAANDRAVLRLPSVDIEELCRTGTRLGVCPYYFARRLSERAPAVFVPFSLVLKKKLLQVDRNSVVVFDEAHSLAEAAESDRSVTLSLSELRSVAVFRGLAPLGELAAFFATKKLSMVKLEDFLVTSGLVECNFFDVEGCAKTALALEQRRTRTVEQLRASLSRLTALKKTAKLCRVLAEDGNDSFLLFDSGAATVTCVSVAGAALLTRILRTAKVVFMSGTFRPFGLFVDTLCKGHKHVLLSAGLSVGPRSKTFLLAHSLFPGRRVLDFTQKGRTQPETLLEVFLLLNTLSRFLRGGVVCFFQNKAFLAVVRQNLSAKMKHTALFFEDTDGFVRYKELVGSGKDAVFCAVVGGSYSEGVDFRDRLCRALFLFGVPFPDVGSPAVLQRARASGRPAFLKEMAAKTINQTLGRALRHAEDFALVFLVGKRFRDAFYLDNLSAAFKKNLLGRNHCLSLKEVVAETKQFFAETTERKLYPEEN